MSVAYQRLVRLIDRRGLSLVLEHALDRRVIVKLCNTCGLSYAGIRTRSVPIETLANDLAKDCFDKEVTGIQVIQDRKSTRLNSSHKPISYAVFCLKKKKTYI